MPQCTENGSAPNVNIDKVKKMYLIAEITVMKNNPRAKPWLELKKKMKVKLLVKAIDERLGKSKMDSKPAWQVLHHLLHMYEVSMNDFGIRTHWTSDY